MSEHISARPRTRILRNSDEETIDEIVVHFIDGTLHIEQMDDHLYSVIVYHGGASISFSMIGGPKKVCRFMDYWDDGWVWDEDQTHA